MIFLAPALFSLVLIQDSIGFSLSTPHRNPHSLETKHTPRTALFMARSGRAPRPPSTGEFEYEELMAQMRAMKKAKLSSEDLAPAKRQELEEYVEGILQKRPSPISLAEMGESLPGTSWRLSLSSSAFASATGLPPDATIFVEFLDENAATYSLQFGDKTFGLKNLKAACEWSCGTVEGAMDPSRAGVVSLQYGKITTDAFGFSNVGVGFFGLLKGRSNYIQTIFFDGNLWIEEGYGPSGERFYNVYLRE